MSRRLLTVVAACAMLCVFIRGGNAEETKVGGHLKLKLYDFSDGKHNNVSSYDYSGFSLSEMILYFSHELTEKVSVDLQPMFDASTGATPAFGKNIGAQRTAAKAVEPKFHGWIKAIVKTVLPKGYELSAGIVKPRFTQEYGAELFWEDQVNGGKFACNNYLGAVHDTGLEIYKPFELGEVSLPAYLYVLNGGYEFSDNNQSPSVMVHVEPELGPLQLTASALYGKWDDKGLYNVSRWSGGLLYKYKAFSARAEYAGGAWQNSIAGATDATPWGYYGKVFYRFAPWGRAMLHYDYVDNNYTGFHFTAPGKEKYVTLTPGVQLYVSQSSILQLQYDMADWQQTSAAGVSDTLKFNRLTLGWRTTF